MIEGKIQPLLGRLIGLVVLCFVVGLALAALGVTAQGILTNTRHTLDQLYRLIADFIGWALPYTLLGAVIVVPLSLLRLIGWRGRRR